MDEADKRNNMAITQWMEYYQKTAHKTYFLVCNISVLLKDEQLSSDEKLDKVGNCISKHQEWRKALPKPWQ